MTKLRATNSIAALALAGLIAGCASPGARVSGVSNASDTSNVGLAMRAQIALGSGDLAGAVSFAERAVERTPSDADFRALLGNAYLASGRFASAEAAYRDSLTLLPGQPAVTMKLVLVSIAMGRGTNALATLDQLRAVADPADVGLAMALAGQPGNAIALLDEAARRPGADGRTRQNLALAHALAGDWINARAIAAQDIPANEVDARMAAWMTLAGPRNPAQQIASLIGVTQPAGDPGQPVRLALRDGGPQMAASTPAPQPVAAVETPVDPAVAQPTQMAETTVFEDPAFAAPSPVPADASVAPSVELAEIGPPAMRLPDVAQTLDALRREPVALSNRLPRVAELRRAAEVRFGKSKVVVQIGAYGSPSKLQVGWSKLAKRHGALGRYTPTTARFVAPIGTVYRLSLKGFASDREARGMCAELKRSGAACFVRSFAGDVPVRFAAR